MKVIFFVFILFIHFNSFLIGQCELNVYLDLLESSNISDRAFALKEIKSCNLTDALDILAQKIHDEQNFTIKRLYLNVIDYLGSEIVDMESISFDFLNEINSFDPEEPLVDIDEARLDATIILFKVGNYTTAQYVFDYINKFEHSPSLKIFNALEKIIDNVPAYQTLARSELIEYVNESIYYYIRALSLTYLIKHYSDSEIQNICLNIATNDDSMGVRLVGFKGLKKTNYEQLHSFLLNRLTNDPSWYLRHIIADSILLNYGGPSDLKTVIDYLPYELNESARTLISSSIQVFIPPRPEIPTIDMIGNLRQYIEELYSYGWIWSEYNYQQYLGLQERIEAAYSEGSLDGICENFNEYFALLESHLGRPHLSEEGYKFLFYHGTYIKENVENELGPCE